MRNLNEFIGITCDELPDGHQRKQLWRLQNILQMSIAGGDFKVQFYSIPGLTEQCTTLNSSRILRISICNALVYSRGVELIAAILTIGFQNKLYFAHIV